MSNERDGRSSRNAGTPAGWWRARLADAGPASPPSTPVRDAEFWEGFARQQTAGSPEAAPTDLDRRTFLQLVAASMALAGAAGCKLSEPDEKIVPYREQPPEVTPGIPVYYATSMLLDGYATGLLVESHVGRPTKIEGNPEHPASLGAAGVFEQASILDLYSPLRSRRVLREGRTSGWHEFVLAMRDAAPAESLRRTHFLLEPTSSPLLGSQIARLRERQPEVGITFYAPLAPAFRMEAAKLAFGRSLDPVYDLEDADIVVTLDADLLGMGPGHLRYAREFAGRRRIEPGGGEMNRLYAVEAAWSPTGIAADHRVPVPSSLVGSVAARIIAELAPLVGPEPPTAAIAAFLGPLAARSPRPELVLAIARDLARHRGRSLVVVGERQPPAVHALGYLLNEALGNVGRTVRYIDPVLLEAGERSHGIAPLLERMQAGEVERLVVLGGDPLATLPPDLGFAQARAKVREVVYAGLFEPASAQGAAWVLPETHYLESWGDGRAYDGTLSLVQPLVRPLYGGKSLAEVLAVFTDDLTVREGRRLLREFWQTHHPEVAAGPGFERALRRGSVENSAAPARRVALDVEAVRRAVRRLAEAAPPPAGLELSLAPDPRLHDGRFSRNPWLLELPAPVTTLTWHNAALLGPQTAATLGVETGDVVALRSSGGSIELPALAIEGHAEGSVTVTLGWGMELPRAPWGVVGADAYRLRSHDAGFFTGDVAMENTGRRHDLARTQGHWHIPHDRPIALAASLHDYRRGENPAHELREEKLESFRTPEPTVQAQWGMSIDMSACLGCGACMIACQAENNVPVVGQRGVSKSREMHWLRIDYYYAPATGDERRVVAQPMLCQHCEKAPCEYVCPTYATAHSADGLNEMTYNRCVGTRFCSNNCPYKVRRFNWFDYNRDKAETEKMQRNPDVTVRARGVMEKCTYCVQRIRQAGITARLEERELRAGELQTACQQACPTRAIEFGDITKPDLPVSRLRQSSRAYGVLSEIGTAPRNRYLVKIYNPNDELEGA